MDVDETPLGYVRLSVDTWGHGLYSPDDRHRYWFTMPVGGPVPAKKPDPLHRDGLPVVAPNTLVWIGLNPSKSDDAGQRRVSLRNVLRWASRGEFERVLVANLYAFRHTQPSQLPRLSAKDRAEAVGTHNDLVLKHLAGNAADILVAWGSGGARGRRGKEVLKLLSSPPWCVGNCKNDQPRHPAPRTGWAIDPQLMQYH